MLELSPGPSSQSSKYLFNSKNQNDSKFSIIRIYYRLDDNSLSNSSTTTTSSIISSTISTLSDIGSLITSPSNSQQTASTSFNSSISSASSPTSPNKSGYFHSFRSCNLRFFNSLVITTNINDELTEALRCICNSIQSTASHFNVNIPFEEVPRYVRKKSKIPPDFVKLSRLSTLKAGLNYSKYQNLANYDTTNNSNNNIGNKLKSFGNKIFDLSKKVTTKGTTTENKSVNMNEIIEIGEEEYIDINTAVTKPQVVFRSKNNE
jgi:hypothetical protein